MSAIVALGERSRVEGFTLAGVRVVAADSRADVRAAWEGLGPDVAVVFLTVQAHECLTDLLPARADAIWTVIPD